MSIGQVIVLAAIVGAFVLFAVTLAWGDYHTQRMVRRIRERDRGISTPDLGTPDRRIGG